MRTDSAVVIGIVFVVVLLAGEVISYGPGVYTAESSVGFSEDGYEVNITTDYPTEYTVLVTSTAANAQDRHLFIYRDSSYPSLIEASYLDYWIDKLSAEMRVYGDPDYTVVNAEGLSYVMEGSVDAGAAEETAVLFMSGILPDTVYGEDSTLLEDWLAAGGALYWTGGPLGLYVGHSESGRQSYEEVSWDPGERFFGVPGSIGDGSSPDNGSTPSKDRGIGKALGIYYDHCKYGVSSDVPGLFLGTENEDGLSSIALCAYTGGSGTIAVFGGSFPPDVKDVAYSILLRVILSGLCYDSEVLTLVDSEKGRGTTTVPITDSDRGSTVVFVWLGDLLGTYGKTERIYSVMPIGSAVQPQRPEVFG